MNNKKVILLAAATMLSSVMARAPRAETFADLESMLTKDVYMTSGIRGLAQNAPEEERAAMRQLRTRNIKALIDIFTHSLPPAKKRKRAELIFPSELLQDANIFSALKLNTVFSNIDKTHTQAGQVVFATTLAEGTTDTSVLKQRAEMIKEFIRHEDLRENMVKILKKFAEQETSLLARWSSSEAASLDKLISASRSRNDWLTWFGNKGYNGFWHATKVIPAGIAAAGWYYGTTDNQSNVALAATTAVATLWFNEIASAKIHQNIAHSMLVEKSIKGFNCLVDTLNKIEAELQEHCNKSSLPASLSRITEERERIVELSKTLNDLVKNGDLNQAAQTLSKVVDRISMMLSFVGEIDAYLGMALHHLDYKGRRNSDGELMTVDFCTINTTSTTPYIRAEGYWNPIIDYKTAKTSIIELGGETQARDAIITGPNAGGKSIALRGLINQLMLSHAYHMAWAKKFETTPFKLVIGQLNNVDDPTAGKSRLMAEVSTMNDIIEKICKLDAAKREFAFVVTDELFTGTEVKPAVGISFKMCQVFADLTNVMYILATHYKELTALEAMTNGIFKNYCVKAYIAKSDTGVNQVTYPYKLFKGVGTINVALDIILLQMSNHDMTGNAFYAKLCDLQAENEAAAKQGIVE